MRSQQKLILLGIWLLFQLLAAIAAGILAAVVLTDSRHLSTHPVLFGIWFGVAFAQVSLIAVWTVFGSGRLLVRTVIAGTAVALVWVVTFLLPEGTAWRAKESVGPAVTMAGQWLIVSLPLWILRLVRGWRFQSPEDEETGRVEGAEGKWCGASPALAAESSLVKRSSMKPASGSVQFGLRELIAWVTIMSVLLGLARTIPKEYVNAELVAFTVLMGFHCLLAWGGVVVGSTLGIALPQTLAAGIATAAICWCQPWAFRLILPTLWNPNFTWFFWINGGVQLLWLVGSLIALRAIGFQIRS